MDLGRVRAHGISTTGKAWITNPIRSAMWFLVAPYFRGIESEIDGCLRLQAASAQARPIPTAQLAGMRKDAVAVAHRLAGLEEDAEANGMAIAALAKTVGDECRPAVEALSKDVAETGETVQALCRDTEAFASLARDTNAAVDALSRRLADTGGTVQTLCEDVAEVADLARKTNEYAAALHRDLRSSVDALNARIGMPGHPIPLREGDRVAVGPDSLTLVATTPETRFLVREHDLTGNNVADRQQWEPHVHAVIDRAGRPDGVAVDVGAYIGVHTVAMSRRFGAVHAFEPQRGIFNLLCANLALNGCNNVTTYNSALYDRVGAMRLASPERQAVAMPVLDGQPDYSRIENASGLMYEPVDDGAGDVRSVVLDDLALDRVAIIKVDAEGADLHALRGAADTIRRCRPLVLFEWHRILGALHDTTLADYEAFFAVLNYDLDVIHVTLADYESDYLASPR